MNKLFLFLCLNFTIMYSAQQPAPKVYTPKTVKEILDSIPTVISRPCTPKPMGK